MTMPPARPKIYHITHLDNLASIVAAGEIESDGRRYRLGLDHATIGMAAIKQRRLFELDVSCHPGTKVGEYVPFYFCPRSIMLYILYRGNHPDMAYHGGQGPILHLQADLESVIDWMEEQGTRWAFSDRNAGTRFTDFFNKRELLDRIDWNAVRSTDFRDPMVKEGKQAEFLVYDVFPWQLVEKIGIFDRQIRRQVVTVLQGAAYKPVVQVEQSWYF